MEAKQMDRVVGFLATLAGGGGAGVADAKFEDKKPGGMTVGTIAGVGASIAGVIMASKGHAHAGKVLAAGSGALAGELYRVGYQKTKAAAAAPPPAAAGLLNQYQYGKGVGALGRGAISQAELAQRMNILRAMAHG